MLGSSATISLPFSTTVVIQAFVNAAWTERFTITPESGDPLVYQGTGYYDVAVGSTTLTTPASGNSPFGFAVTVTIDHSQDGGITWQPSQVDSGACAAMWYNVYTVCSEDATDDTWDDATVYFTWTQLPAPSQPETTDQFESASPAYVSQA